jgi:hypothetical protein
MKATAVFAGNKSPFVGNKAMDVMNEMDGDLRFANANPAKAAKAAKAANAGRHFRPVRRIQGNHSKLRSYS